MSSLYNEVLETENRVLTLRAELARRTAVYHDEAWSESGPMARPEETYYDVKKSNRIVHSSEETNEAF